MWKLNTNQNTAQDIAAKIEETDGDLGHFPLEVHGEILLKEKMIEEINVADDETLLMELRLTIDPRS